MTPPTPDVLQPSIVGSLPKPAWLAEPNVLRAPWRLSGAALAEAQDDAVRVALLDQEEAGLAVVTDGEMRRRHYIWGFLDGLTNTELLRAMDVLRRTKTGALGLVGLTPTVTMHSVAGQRFGVWLVIRFLANSVLASP